MSAPQIVVVGSVNLDLVATGARLPSPGETVTGATFARHPGGKGANQALAARRLGADVWLLARVGRDAMAEEALALLRASGVDLSGCVADASAPTGVALIAVAADGENQIVVAPGANAAFAPDQLMLPPAAAVLCQLELPAETVAKAASLTEGLFCVNLAPARAVDDVVLQRADLIVVNETEAAFYGAALNAARGKVAVTHGARGAMLLRNGEEIAHAPAPKVTAIDATGAGDAFVGALMVALLEKMPDDVALRFACAAGGLAATKAGAQPSLPVRAEVDALLRAT